MTSLQDVRDRMGDCKACPLWEGRTNLVFGVGNPYARVMFIGEGPGKNEDLQGEPFVGAAGKFLNELLDIAGLRREDVYIANILKCRPPGNRDPQPGEIAACTPWLREQIKVIHPEYLVTLGNFATKFVLKTERGITSLHGQVMTTGPFTVMPMFHPAAAIYDQSKKDLLRDDFRKLGLLLDEKYPRHQVEESR
ncbi:MAG: uracil-DNA glycosylase [Coriobacteriales bacterium]|nr:uracil-DNA glycosylase [Coriobacteriales bacterium]